MPKEMINRSLLETIITLHDKHVSPPPKKASDLYESDDAMMWDGYIEPIAKFNQAIDSAFRYNANLEPVSIADAYKPGGIESLSLAQVGFLFRDILVNEKCHQGLFASVIMDGRVTRLVNRLKSILRKEESRRPKTKSHSIHTIDRGTVRSAPHQSSGIAETEHATRRRVLRPRDVGCEGRWIARR